MLFLAEAAREEDSALSDASLACFRLVSRYAEFQMPLHEL